MNSEWTFRLIACGARAALAGLFAFAPAVWAQAPAKPPVKPAAEPLGRMFFTPAQRAQLDIARTQRARATLSTAESEEMAAPVSQTQTVTYGGMVRRSDGKSTVWINNRPVHDNEPAGGTIVGRVRPDGSISLQVPQTGRSVDLKPGQRVELLSGAIEESYARKPPAAEPESASGAKSAAKPAPEAKGAKPAAPEAANIQR